MAARAPDLLRTAGTPQRDRGGEGGALVRGEVARHRRVDETGGDAVASDPLRCEQAREGANHRQHRALARGVVDAGGEAADLARNRGERDDAAVAGCGAQQRHRLPDEEEGAARVDRHDGVPLLHGDLIPLRVGAGPRVADQHVKLRPPRAHLDCQVSHGAGVAQLEGRGVALDARAAHRGERALSAGAVARVCDPDVRSALREPDRRGGADAGGGSGHERSSHALDAIAFAAK